MAKNTNQDWAEKQIAALVAVGVDLQVAQATIKRILDRLPEGEDPGTYEPIDSDSVQITPADIVAARAAWYAADNVPPKYKRLLDAVLDEPNG